MTTTISPYRSEQAAGADGFVQLLHAEWTKFRTVRGWVITTVVAGLLIVLIAFLTANDSHASTCTPSGCTTSAPTVLTGPGGEAVDDSFTFVHQPLPGDGRITARLTSMTGRYSPNGAVGVGPNGPIGLTSGLQPWSKAGLIVKQNLEQGSAYVAVMVTGSHGVRLQYDYTGDIAGLANTQTTVSAATPRWLRLTRSGTTFTGYESADGTTWTAVGTVRLPTLSGSALAGLFAACPSYTVTQNSFGGSHGSGGPAWATGAFDHVALQGGTPGATDSNWTGSLVGGNGGPGGQAGPGFTQHAGTFSVTGSGDIAPGVGGGSGDSGDGIERILVGAFAGLLALIVLAAMFITGEYRRGLIRTTLAASPRRGRLLAAKVIVIGGVALLAGLIAAAISIPMAEHLLNANGNAIFPVDTLTKARVIVGTAALLAVVAVLTLAVGTLLRRSAGAITLVVAVTVLPYIIATANVLPTAPAQWLLRLTPAAGFAIQQSLVQYPQVNADYNPANGYFPLPPWGGFAVLCGYTALALALAAVALRRRDA